MVPHLNSPGFIGPGLTVLTSMINRSCRSQHWKGSVSSTTHFGSWSPTGASLSTGFPAKGPAIGHKGISLGLAITMACQKTYKLQRREVKWVTLLAVFFLAHIIHHLKKYVASSDPHHGIQFIWHSVWHSISHIFWHSICHVFWHSIWHIVWHSICHILWHSTWHIYLAFHLACLLTFYLAYLRTVYLAYLLTFYLEYLLTFYLAYLLTLYLAPIWQIFWHSIWHTLWHSIRLCFWPLRSGWGPARPTARRISPVKVRRGPQCSEPRRLRSGEAHSAHSAQTLAGWGLARPTAIKSWQMRSGEAHCDQELADEVRRGPLRSRAGTGAPARPTAIESWQLRSGEPHGLARKEWRRRRRASSLKI